MYAVSPARVNLETVASTASEFIDEFAGTVASEAEIAWESFGYDASDPDDIIGSAGLLAIDQWAWAVTSPEGVGVTEESGGSLHIDLGDSEDNASAYDYGMIQTNKADYKLDFWKTPTRIEINDIVYGGSQTTNYAKQFRFFLSSEKGNSKAVPDAFSVLTRLNNIVQVSTKESEVDIFPEDVTKLYDAFPSSEVIDLIIEIDKRSYRIECIFASGDPTIISGEHGLTEAEWPNVYFGIEGTANVSTSNVDGSVELDVGNVTIKQQVMFDTFDHSNIRNSGSIQHLWTEDKTYTDSSITSSGGTNVFTANKATNYSAAYKGTRVSRQYNPFTSILEIKVDGITFAGASAADDWLEFAFCSEGKNPIDSRDALMLRVCADGDYEIYFKDGEDSDAGHPKANGTLITSGAHGSSPTSFKFTVDYNNVSLEINGAVKETDEAHNITHEKFGPVATYQNSCDCSIWIGGCKDASGVASAAPSAGGVTIERTQDFKVANVVLGPMADHAPTDIPPMPRQQNKIHDGIVDVTRAPFNASNGGVIDCTNELKHAIEFCRDWNLLIFFPEGEYLVSDTLDFVTKKRARAKDLPANGEAEDGGVRALGSYAGASRPKIILAAASEGFNEDAGAKARKPVIRFFHYQYSEGTNKISWDTVEPHLMASSFQNIDVEVRGTNGGAIGIQMQGAQGCNLTDVTVDLAQSGYSCLDGLNGSGGGNNNVKLIGGQLGVNANTTYNYWGPDATRTAGGSQPCPTLSGCTFDNQATHAIDYHGPQNLTVVGCHFTRCPTTAIRTPNPQQDPSTWIPVKGYVSVIDSTFEWETYYEANVAIGGPRSLYIKNSYFNKCGEIAYFNDEAESLAGFDGWKEVGEYAQATQPPEYKGYNKAGAELLCQYEQNFYEGDDRRDYSTVYSVGVTTSSVTVPSDLYSRHKPDFFVSSYPHIESQGALNVRLAGAVGDGLTDCHAILQGLIDTSASAILFFPKGVYRVSEPLVLGTSTQLIGLGKNLVTILPTGETADFDDAGAPRAVIETPAGAASNPVVDNIRVQAPPAYAGANCIYSLSGQAVFKDVWVSIRDDYGYSSYGTRAPTITAREHFAVWFGVNAGGRVFHMSIGRHDSQVGSGRHFYFTNDAPNGADSDRLKCYSLNPEHAKTDAQTEFKAAKHIDVFGMKTEGNYCQAWFSDGADDINIFGGGGNGAPVIPADPDTAPYWPSDWTDRDTNCNGASFDPDLFPCMFRLDADVTGITIVQTQDYGRFAEDTAADGEAKKVFGTGMDGNENYWIWDGSRSPNKYINAKDRPVLYKSVN